MAIFHYNKYKILIDPDSKKSQGLQVGDVVRRQYTDQPNLIYSLMVVLDTGIDLIGGKESHYFVGALLEGEEPRNGQLLDFVRVTSLIDNDRSGALYLTASDNEAPYMDVIDGLGTEHSLILSESVLRTETSYRFPLTSKVSNPEKLIIAYRIRASKPLNNIPLTIGYADETDGADTIDITTEWQYRLSVITIEYPSQYVRELCIAPPLVKGDWCEITDLNIVRLSDIANFSKATKARMGRIKGIIDPVFGVLDGYGAYFQNLYATRNVNIAGTLTAGDENGFASTFYVGKIHKNVILNSIDCNFTDSEIVELPTPVGIGKARRISTNSSLTVQSSSWREEHVGRKYCFSVWIYSGLGNISFYQDEYLAGTIPVSCVNEWRRYHIVFTAASSNANSMTICLRSEMDGVIATAPQLEAGSKASQYQPTDGKLSYTEDYGAWFNKGGIGGTIQNPLLRLNEDGSISSNNGSFVINRDGSGYFANGSIHWDEKNVVLGDNVTLRWVNFSEEAKNKIKEQIEGITVPDWVQEWDSGKTVIDSTSVITPKIFAGIKNADNTVTGIALGRYSLLSRNEFGSIITETVDGIYGFRDGYKTFFVDSGGNAQLGRGNQFVKYDAVTGKVVFGSDVSLNWIGATYIDASGVFTGTLSANTVNAIRIDASQINAGTIDASRIDTAALKAALITAGNIEALTLNVIKGKIGGWTIDGDSISLGAKNNTLEAYTSASGAMTIGSAGIRGYKWRLDATGAGAVAGGNISWDAAGTVTFDASVSLNWTTPIGNINNALGGTSFPKLTNISSTGIYTGSITAEQITAGTISADRIAAGSINSTKLDATSIKANIINTAYINGLSCTFIQGTIGGWTINSGSISGGQIVLDKTNNRIAVFSTSSSSTTGRRVQLYYSNDADFGFYATDAAGICIAQLGSSNQIAGWVINSSQIYKNSVYLGADGSITNGSMWKLNNDGSGQIAAGNISWNIAGKITFSESVAMNWKNDIEAAQRANFGYPYYKKIVINGDANNYYPVVIKGGDQNFKRDILVRRAHSEQAPDTWNNATHKGGLILLIKTNFGSWGGINYSWDIYELSELYCRMFAGAAHCGNYCMFSVFLRGGGTTGSVYHLYSDQPLDSVYLSESPVSQEAPQICYNSDLIFKSGSTLAYAPAPRTLTTAVEEEIRRRRFIALAQTSDTTLSEHPLTYIGSTGIYTGTLTAVQVNSVAINAGSITTGTLNADRIAAGSINSTKLDAASIQANIINATYINGLSCSFVRGTIGGFTIGSDSMSVGVIGGVGATPIQIRSMAAGSGAWYTGAYKPFGITITWHQTNNAGHVVMGQIAASASAIKTGFIGLQMMSHDNLEYFCLSANTALSGSKEVYNRIAGWAFDSTKIWKNNVNLSADGSIVNGTAWKLNNDGSGQIANASISWDAAGTVTFSSAVSLNWSNLVNSGRLYARGTGFNNVASRLVSLNGSYIANDGSRGLTLTVINRNALTLISSTNYDVYANETVCNSLASALNALASDKIVVITSYDAIRINSTLNIALQRCGGRDWITTDDRTPYVLVGIPGIGKGNGLVSVFSSASSEPYAEISTTIQNGIPLGVNTNGKIYTYIDGNGIYTGSITASQITAGTIDASRIDTNSLKAAIVTAGNINALTLNIDKGYIGGWTLNSTSLYAGSVYLSSSGTIYNGSYWKLNSDGSGLLASNNIYWDAAGNITMKNATIQDVVIKGSIRAPFVRVDGSIYVNIGGGPVASRPDSEKYDNLCVIGGTDSGGWGLQTPPLPWSVDQSGRRLCLTHYRYNSEYVYGTVTFTAPAGQYFYENGTTSTTLKMSREVIELMGYGSATQFYGWIVLNRRDLYTSGRYGKFQQVLANGIVTLSGTTVSLKYKTYDGGTISVSRTAVGKYTVYLPWSLESKYFVLMTGYYTGSSPIYATVMGIYSSYFQVQTQDDSSANEGSFCFQVISTADW